MQASLDSIAIESMVAKPAWKAILLELMLTKSIDPWNIDIVDICDSFVKKVRDMKTLDLLIPANVILAAAILLRYKSDYLCFEDDNVEPPMPDDQVPTFSAEDFPQLTIASRIPPKRQITMQELMAEMERIIKYEGAERMVRNDNSKLEIISLALNSVDMEKKMEETLNLIKQNMDEEKLALFSNMVKGKNKNEIIFYVLSILHLTQKNLIDIRQERLWGDIFIQLV